MRNLLERIDGEREKFYQIVRNSLIDPLYWIIVQDVDNIAQVFLRDYWKIAWNLMDHSNEVHSINVLIDEFHVKTKNDNGIRWRMSLFVFHTSEFNPI
jgi:hypothetical protein